MSTKMPFTSWHAWLSICLLRRAPPKKTCADTIGRRFARMFFRIFNTPALNCALASSEPRPDTFANCQNHEVGIERKTKPPSPCPRQRSREFRSKSAMFLTMISADLVCVASGTSRDGRNPSPFRSPPYPIFQFHPISASEPCNATLFPRNRILRMAAAFTSASAVTGNMEIRKPGSHTG